MKSVMRLVDSSVLNSVVMRLLSFPTGRIVVKRIGGNVSVCPYPQTTTNSALFLLAGKESDKGSARVRQPNSLVGSVKDRRY
ncbi:hypothetical protein Ddc_08323 [Ditylenchus destructor]|nr:hypothetical protein Ddc_08323 [Ditylenchus destructor]